MSESREAPERLMRWMLAWAADRIAELEAERDALKDKVESLEYELSLHVEVSECHHCGEDTCVCND